MNSDQKNFLRQAAEAAAKAGHIFALMAACEACLESRDPKAPGFGLSQLAREDNNLFGMKQHRHAVYGTHTLPTKEFENGEWVERTADWVKYPDWPSCFSDRMSTLNRLSPYLAHYRAALAATSPENYVREVSQSWSTDPGWHCSCGVDFLTEDSATKHAPGVAGHTVTRIPGLGRALKVLAIYNAMAGDWDAGS